jgi:TIR domain
MSSIFLSHNHKDKEFVRRLANNLRAYGVKVWVDEAEILVGDSLIQKIGEGIEEMEYLGVVLSPNSVDSKWVQREIEVATNKEINGRKVKVLPILYRKCKMPPFLEGKLYADFTLYESYQSGLQGLLKRLVPNYLTESESNPPRRNFQELESLCHAGLSLHLTNLTGQEIGASQIKIKISENAEECNLIWGNTLQTDQLCRPIIDSSLTNPWIRPSSEEPKDNTVQQGVSAEWIQKVQAFELALLEKMQDRPESLDEAQIEMIDQTVGRVWDEDNIPMGIEAATMGGVLYWHARFALAEKRHSYLYPDDSRDPFAPLIKLYDDNLYFMGMSDDGTFYFYSPLLAGTKEKQNSFRLAPILVDQEIIPYSFRKQLNRTEGLHDIPSKNRISKRETALRLQRLAAGYALGRHFGCVQRVLFFYELVYTGYDPSKFASLLRVASHSLRQLRELTSDDSGDLSWLPSFDISRIEFDRSTSLWGNDGMIKVTRFSASEGDSLCADPILDIQLINYADEPCIVSEFIFRHYGTWYDARPLAGAFYGTLESTHTYNVEVDFDKDINSISLDPPFFMGPKSPGRFKIRLLNLREKISGHYAYVQFGFKSGEDVCDTEIFCIFTK